MTFNRSRSICSIIHFHGIYGIVSLITLQNAARYNTFDECRTKMKKKKTFQKNKIKHELKHVLDFQYKSNDACTLTFDFSKYFPDDENNALYLCKYWRRLTSPNHIQINRTHATKERGIFPYVLNIEIYIHVFMVWFWALVCIWTVDDQCKLSSMRIDCLQSRTKRSGMSSNPKNALKDALIKWFANESMQKWSRLSFNYTKTICKKSQRALTIEYLTKRSDTLNIQQRKNKESRLSKIQMTAVTD